MTDFLRGRIAAQLDEPYNMNETEEWKQGYVFEIIFPSGGLTTQEEI